MALDALAVLAKITDLMEDNAKLTGVLQILCSRTNSCYMCATGAGEIRPGKYLITRHCGCPAKEHDTQPLCGDCTRIASLAVLAVIKQEGAAGTQCSICRQNSVLDEPQLIVAGVSDV